MQQQCEQSTANKSKFRVVGGFVPRLNKRVVKRGTQTVVKTVYANGNSVARAYKNKSPLTAVNDELDDWEALNLNPKLAADGTVILECHIIPSDDPLLEVSEDTRVGHWTILMGDAAYAKVFGDKLGEEHF